MVGVLVAVLATLVMSASADALTLGTTTMPVGSTPVSCPTGGSTPVDELQAGTDASYDYTVPAGGGAITSWSFNTAGATAGTPYGLIVLRPSVSGAYTVVGADYEVVPATLPPIATFTLAAPMLVQSGDLIGVVSLPTTASDCGWQDSPLTAADLIAVADGSGQTVGSLITTGGGEANTVLNVSVNLVPEEDVGLTQQALPGSILAGKEGVFLLSVTSGGPASVPVTVEDAVPTGLKIDSVYAGAGNCTISLQNIACTVPSAPASIVVVVTAAAAGQYTNAASVIDTTLTDPNPGNNTSYATLDVDAVQACHLFSLANLTQADAELVIQNMGCAVGTVKTETSKSIPKGDVISISPAPGKTVELGTKIAIVVSSGKPKPKKTPKHRRR
jgi:hypothetical protein